MLHEISQFDEIAFWGHTLRFALRGHCHQPTILSLRQLFSSPVTVEPALPPLPDRGCEPADNPVVAEPALSPPEAAVPLEENEVIS